MANLPPDWGEGYPNVWLGVSVENQSMFNKRVSELAMVPARVRFLSIEPLIGQIDFYKSPDWLHVWQKIGWVIVGGESGNHTGKFRFRECSVEWMQNIVAQCVTLAIPVFVKQMGTFIADAMGMKDKHGGDIDEFPVTLQVRQFPNQ